MERPTDGTASTGTKDEPSATTPGTPSTQPTPTDSPAPKGPFSREEFLKLSREEQLAALAESKRRADESEARAKAAWKKYTKNWPDRPRSLRDWE